MSGRGRSGIVRGRSDIVNGGGRSGIVRGREGGVI